MGMHMFVCQWRRSRRFAGRGMRGPRGRGKTWRFRRKGGLGRKRKREKGRSDNKLREFNELTLLSNVPDLESSLDGSSSGLPWPKDIKFGGKPPGLKELEGKLTAVASNDILEGRRRERELGEEPGRILSRRLRGTIFAAGKLSGSYCCGL